MNANGVLASLELPDVPASFCGQLFGRIDDKDVAQALVRAYNDWHIDEWCGRLPGAVHPAVDPAALGPRADGRRGPPGRRRAATRSRSPRTRRSSACRATTPTTGTRSGRRATTTRHVVCLHIGSSSQLVITAPEAPIDVMITLTAHQHRAGDRRPPLVARVHAEFPGLQVALSEGGIGWIPYFLERVDYVYEHHHAWTGPDFGGRLPERGVPRALLDLLHRRRRRRRGAGSRSGLDHITWEMRLPALRLDVAARARALRKAIGGLPDDDDPRRSRHRNAMRRSPSTRSPTAPPSGARSERCGPRRPTSTSRSRAWAGARPTPTPVHSRRAWLRSPRRVPRRAGSDSVPDEHEILDVTEARRVLEVLVTGLDAVVGDPLVPLAQGDAQLAARQV